MRTIADPQTKLLTPLAWDTEHFGFPVARVDPRATDDDLCAALTEARLHGIRLAYWSAADDRVLPDAICRHFGGQLVDHKLTFARSLAGFSAEQLKSDDIAIQPFAHARPSQELLALAIAAGEYSRFAVDCRFPRDKFESLYRIWIERSVSGEIAGVVLAACDSATPNAASAGMITVKVTDGVGNIGLVAVAASHRGRGIGTRLIEAAERWMRERGATKSTVITQGANAPACRLYDRAGYTVEQAENVYHFWP